MHVEIFDKNGKKLKELKGFEFEYNPTGMAIDSTDGSMYINLIVILPLPS